MRKKKFQKGPVGGQLLNFMLRFDLVGRERHQCNYISLSNKGGDLIHLIGRKTVNNENENKNENENENENKNKNEYKRVKVKSIGKLGNNVM